MAAAIGVLPETAAIADALGAHAPAFMNRPDGVVSTSAS
jgi:hypothetical protein